MVAPQINAVSAYQSRTVYTFALITSLICIVGFSLDMVALSLRPTLSSIEWRMGYMQQLGERGIIFLFGVTLLCCCLQPIPVARKQLSWFCCGLGLCISLSGFFYLQDSFRFKSLAIENLNTQRQTLEQQIQQLTPPPTAPVAPAVISARKEEALKLLQERTQTLESRANIRIQKTMTRTFCSLILVGTGLFTLGQVTLRSKRCRNQGEDPSNLQDTALRT